MGDFLQDLGEANGFPVDCFGFRRSFLLPNSLPQTEICKSIAGVKSDGVAVGLFGFGEATLRKYRLH